MFFFISPTCWTEFAGTYLCPPTTFRHIPPIERRAKTKNLGSSACCCCEQTHPAQALFCCLAFKLYLLPQEPPFNLKQKGQWVTFYVNLLHWDWQTLLRFLFVLSTSCQTKPADSSHLAGNMYIYIYVCRKASAQIARSKPKHHWTLQHVQIQKEGLPVACFSD